VGGIVSTRYEAIEPARKLLWSLQLALPHHGDPPAQPSEPGLDAPIPAHVLIELA
jgi:hypothetical protein